MLKFKQGTGGLFSITRRVYIHTRTDTQSQVELVSHSEFFIELSSWSLVTLAALEK